MRDEPREATATPGVILALLDHPSAASGLLAAACRLAELSGGARINALAARVPPASTIMPTEEVMTREHEARLRAQEVERVGALKAVFDAWNATAGRPGGEAEWFECEAVASGLVAEWGKRADVIVVERPDRNDRGTTWQALPAALFATDRPVLVVPPGSAGTFGRHVAIAWRDDPHARRAVLSVLRYVGPAARVHVLAGMPAGAPRPVIPDILAEHGVVAELLVIPIDGGPFGSALLAGARVSGADLLVMGAFAHSPLRELIFGGVTQYVLDHADLPILMRH